MNTLALALTRIELTEDPHDFIETHALHVTAYATQGAVLFAAVYLVLHGVAKLVLAVAILRGKLWACQWMIGVLLAFITYQVYQAVVAQGTALVSLTIIDMLIVFLTWHE